MADAPNDPEATMSVRANAALLSEVVATLLRLPYEERTKDLHIRALRLKRRIEPWEESTPTESEVRAARESILALRSETAACLSTR